MSYGSFVSMVGVSMSQLQLNGMLFFFINVNAWQFLAIDMLLCHYYPHLLSFIQTKAGLEIFSINK